MYGRQFSAEKWEETLPATTYGIEKYLGMGDNLAREHYLTLDKTAKGCISCGHCDSRCPFHVRQSERMKMICAAFGI